MAPPATASLPEPEPRTAEEQTYLDAVVPLVERLVGEGRSLAELGTERSRNVLELRTRSDRFRSTADEIRALTASGPIPERLATFSSTLEAGIASALVEIEAAQSAFLRFAWDDLEVAVARFGEAVERIARTVDLVDAA